MLVLEAFNVLIECLSSNDFMFICANDDIL